MKVFALTDDVIFIVSYNTIHICWSRFVTMYFQKFKIIVNTIRVKVKVKLSCCFDCWFFNQGCIRYIIVIIVVHRKNQYDFVLHCCPLPFLQGLPVHQVCHVSFCSWHSFCVVYFLNDYYFIYDIVYDDFFLYYNNDTGNT